MRDFETIRRMERDDWNRNATFYRYEPHTPLMQHLAARRDALYAIQPGERILDLGCGTGAAVARLRARGVDAVGIDFAPEMIRAAHEQWALNEHTRIADAAELPFGSQSFDVVLADGVLHHLAVQGKLAAALGELRRVLKPGGRLCVFDRNGSVISALLLRAAITAKMLIGRTTGKRHYPSSATRNEIPFGGPRDRQRIKQHGFRPLRAKPVASAPFFIGVVMLNAVQYFFSLRWRNRIEQRLAPLLTRIDNLCALGVLCVEEISVWERVPTRMIQGSAEVRSLSTPDRTALIRVRSDEAEPVLVHGDAS